MSCFSRNPKSMSSFISISLKSLRHVSRCATLLRLHFHLPVSRHASCHLQSQEIVMDGAANMEWSLYGAMLVGNKAAIGSEHGLEAEKGSESDYGGSDDSVASCGAELSRVNERLSRQYMSEQEDVAWLMSLLDGLSIPKSSPGTSADMKNTSELSNVKFRKCEVIEENCS